MVMLYIWLDVIKNQEKEKGEDGWETVPNEFVWWINDYRKITDDSEVILHN